jgi:hypothetical protein
MNTFALSIFHTHRLIPRACFFLTILVFTLLCGRVGYAQQSATLNCGQTDTINFGQILKGDSVEFPLALINNLSKTDTAWSVAGGLSYFKIPGPSNGGASFDSSWLTNVILNADTLGMGPVTTTITITPTPVDSACPAVHLLLQVEVIDSTADSTTFSLQNTSPQVIAIQSNSNSTSRLFYFKNNSTAPDTIESVQITGTKAFSIDTAPPKNFVLAPKDSFLVRLTYNRSSQGFDNGDLVIGMPDNPILLEVALQGVRTGNDAVQIQPTSSTYFTLYPNPSFGAVTIHSQNITHAHLTITDVLGRTLTETSFTGDWLWDRSGANGIAPSGTYFIIVTGIGNNGESVHEVKRVVLE